ncbi:MAG: hypothetical protein FWF79_09630 [Defluviitaleaceae bacterium]|nr:hypothetical protein [Defluviitaleaceae bacterium]
MTAEKGNIGTGRLISIKQPNMLGEAGMDRSKMPPELLLRIRETLANGLAKNFISKALEEMQPAEDCEAVA